MKKARDRAKELRWMRSKQRRSLLAGRRRRRWLAFWHRNKTKTPNERLRVEALAPGTVWVRAPAQLNLLDQADVTLAFVNEFTSALRSVRNRMVCDLRECEFISPEIGVVLLAILEAESKAHPRRIRLLYASRNLLVNEVLRKIGFYDHFKKFGRQFAGLNDLRLTLLHSESGTTVAGETVARLIDEFDASARWRQQEKQLLYSALLECLGNVAEWAYPEAHSTTDWLRHRWWLAGMHDKESGQLWFCVFDLGVGIPATIRTRFGDLLPLFRESDEALIVKAVEQGEYSRTKKKTRGTGLPALKEFVDEWSNGEMQIVTANSRCRFSHSATAESEKCRDALPGTLIVWTAIKRSDAKHTQD